MLKKYDRTHQTILAVGMDLLRENGFDQVGILDICKAAEISRPSFYIHFKSKEQLLAEYFESTVFLTQELVKWVEFYKNPIDRLVRLWLAYCRHLDLVANVELMSHYLSWRILNGSDDSMDELNRSLQALMLPYIREAQKAGFIGNRSDPVYLCRSIMLLHNGSLYEWCLSDGQNDRYRQFFWDLESILQIHEDFRGSWKLEEHFPDDHLLSPEL